LGRKLRKPTTPWDCPKNKKWPFKEGIVPISKDSGKNRKRSPNPKFPQNWEALKTKYWQT